MGGDGSGRKPNPNNVYLEQAPIGDTESDSVIIPDFSGVSSHDRTLIDFDNRYELKGAGGSETDPVFLALSGSLGYVATETDPIFLALSGSLDYIPTGTETEPVFLAASGAYLTSYTETDPKFMELSGAFLTAETDPQFIALSGAFLKAETDPIWLAQSGAYVLTADLPEETDPQFMLLSGAFALLDEDVNFRNITTTGSVDGTDIAGMSGFVTLNTSHRNDTSGADHSALVTAVGLNTSKDTNIAHPLVEEAVPSGAVFTDTQLVEADITTMGFTKDVEVDWTADQGASNINAANYTNTTYAAGDFAHNSLADLNDGTSYEHITQTQKDALHTSGSDTALGAQSENLDMNTHKIVSLTAPSANGDAMRATTKITEAKMEAADDHVNDNTQAHSDYLLNSGTDIAVGPLTITADNSTADQAYVPMVLYNTDDTPPTASGFPVGTLYVQYTA